MWWGRSRVSCRVSKLATVRPERNGDKGNETVLGKSCNVQPKLAAVILVGSFYDVGVWRLVDGMVWLSARWC